MVKKLFKRFNHGQKGFTLIELLVVVAILGVLAAVAIPNVAKFIGKGEIESANTELALVQTAITAGLADAKVSKVEGDGELSKDADVVITGDYSVGDYIQGGNGKLVGSYTIDENGNIIDAEYPDLDVVKTGGVVTAFKEKATAGGDGGDGEG